MDLTDLMADLARLEQRVLSRSFLQEAPGDFARGVGETVAAVRSMMQDAAASSRPASTRLQRTA